MAGGEAHSLACSRDGDSVWSWGAGHYGQLGIGGLDARLAPTGLHRKRKHSADVPPTIP